jgi:hypothetical protein
MNKNNNKNNNNNIKQYKIYIKEYNISKITDKILEKIDVHFNCIKNTKELVSNQGLYSIKNNKIFKKNIIDIPLNYIFFENKTELIIDKSYFEFTEIISHIPINHILIENTIFYYSIQKTNCGTYRGVQFVIEGFYDTINDNNNKYLNYIITDFYFLANGEIDDFFIKKEINVFLSLLN